MIAFLLFWEASVAFGWANPLFTSSPSRIWAAGYEMFRDGSIYPDLAVSAEEFVLGYGLAVIVGVPLGILMGWYSRLNAVLDPFVNALYATPRIALMPLIIIWFGIDLSAKIAIIFLSTVFPILVNTMTGVRTMERDFVKVARSFGASDGQLFKTVALPSSVPNLLTGLAARAWPRADRHRGRRDVWRLGRHRLHDADGGRHLSDRQGDGRHPHHRRRRHGADASAEDDRKAIRRLAPGPSFLSVADVLRLWLAYSLCEWAGE